MKKFLFLAAIAATLVISISSCGKKEEEGTDLTVDIVGTYVGTIVDSVAGSANQYWTNQTVTVTKVDNSKVHVSSGGGVLSSFTASVASSSDGFALTASPQTSGSYNLTGTAKYLSSNHTLNNIMYLVDGSGTTIEYYQGTKQ